MPDPDFHNLTWEHGNYLFSTDKRWINLETLRTAFGDPSLYWTRALPPKAMKKMVENSLCFSLVHFPTNGDWEQVGFARIVTDYVTMAYLTDVYIIEAHQGKGLGKWMISCIPEVLDEMPDLRRTLVLTSTDGKGEKFYADTMGTTKLTNHLIVLNRKGHGNVV